MADFLIRANEGCSPDPSLLPDSVHRSIEDGTDFVCDFAIAAPGADTLNVGGLQAIATLGTAVYLLLFTDLYCPPAHPLAWLADGDNRGWWGDGVDVRGDLNELPLGSLLWLLERAPLVIEGIPIERWAETFAQEALAVLISQGAVVAMNVSATVDTAFGRLELRVQLFGRDGAQSFDQRFAVIWQQLK